MLKVVSNWILGLLGWKVTGSYADTPAKIMLVAMPHTSNMDFPLGLLVRNVMQVKISYAAKHTLFKPPFGWLFRILGGYPINRTKKSNLVEQIADLYKQHPVFRMVIAPEGTRKKVETLKSGFYHIAHLAKIPLRFVAFDYGKKEVRFSESFFTTGNIEADFQVMFDFFRGVQGRHPKLQFEIPTTSSR